MNLKIGKIYKIHLNKNYERSNVDDVYLHFASKLTRTKEGELYNSNFNVQVLKNVESYANIIFVGYEGEKQKFLRFIFNGKFIYDHSEEFFQVFKVSEL